MSLFRRLKATNSRKRPYQIVENLEARTLLNATLGSAITPINVAPGAGATSIDLNAHFSDPMVSGTTVIMHTTQGDIPIGLFDSRTPNTVANFLHYAVSEYNNTVIQRVVPGFIVQGGTFLPDQSMIPQAAPIASEHAIPDTVGTIAMALGSDINSATSGWFINLANNTSLDNPSFPFTVFGHTLYGGMAVVNQIASLPLGMNPPNFVPNPAAGDPPGGTLPLMNYTQGNPVTPANYVEVTSVQTVPALSYTASSDNPALVNAMVASNVLTLNYGSGIGLAHVTITATDLGGNVVHDVLTVGVGVVSVNVGKGTGVRLVRFTDPDGTASQISLSGPGTATISLLGSGITQSTRAGILTVTGTPQAVSISTTGTTAATTLSISGHGGNGAVNLASITSDGLLRAIIGPNTALGGDLSVASGVSNLTLASASNGSITLGSSLKPTIHLGNAANENLTSSAAVASLSATAWTGTGTVNTPSLTRASFRNSFTDSVIAGSVGSFTAGSITGGAWTVSGNAALISAGAISGWQATFGTLGKVIVRTTLDSSTINSGGNLASITAGKLSNDNIYAGVSGLATGQNLPNMAAQFSSAAAIGTISTRSFVNDNVAASTLGRLLLGTIQLANGGMPFGLAAHTEIVSVSGLASGKHLRLQHITSTAQATTDFQQQGITPQDLLVDIV